ncbi:MAG: hypothetical protein M3198_16765 [Actinomycetota bacterium]|nr:hypothetical protein [Actinomycetota bacterium]
MVRHRKPHVDRPASGRGASTRRVLFVLAFSATLVGAGASPARTCPVTDPKCALDKVQEIADDPQGEVEEVVEDPVGAVEESVDEVDRTVGEVEDTVQDTVTSNEEPDVEEPPTPPTEPEPGPLPRDETTDPKGKEEDARVKSALQRRGPHEEEDRREAALGPAPVDPPETPGTPLRTASASVGKSELEDRPELGESVLEAAKDFAFPLALTLLVGIYVAVQHRIDRRDPKLVLAPVDHEYLSFE